MIPKSGNRFSEKIMLKLKSMIPNKPAPGHSRPKDGVASLAYDTGSRVVPDFRRAKLRNSGKPEFRAVETGFPPSRSPLSPRRSRLRRSQGRRAKEGQKRSCANKKLEPRSDSIKTDMALARLGELETASIFIFRQAFAP
jgi:hypothetical protein